MTDPVKTVVVGAGGYVGSHLLRAVRATHPDCVGTGRTAGNAGLFPLDLRNPRAPVAEWEQAGHQAVLIAAAKPNVGYCEQHPDEAYAVNVRGTLDLVDQVARTSMQVVFVSSDYVFDGVGGGFTDEEAPAPTTTYGRQKAEVERQLPDRAGRWLVLRLSKIFGTAPRDGTLLDELGAALAARRPVRVATDQRFSPTLVTDLVAAVLAVQLARLEGVINVCGPEAATRHQLASALARAMGADPGLVHGVPLHDVPGMDGRPLDTSMRANRLAAEVGIGFTPLADSIARVAANWVSGD